MKTSNMKNPSLEGAEYIKTCSAESKEEAILLLKKYNSKGIDSPWGIIDFTSAVSLLNQGYTVTANSYDGAKIKELK